MENIKVHERINVRQFADEDIMASLSVSIEREEEDYGRIEHAGEGFGISLENLKNLKRLITIAIVKFEEAVSEQNMQYIGEKEMSTQDKFAKVWPGKVLGELEHPDDREQVKELKDGRIIWKTHNGFKCWLQDKKGKVTEVTAEYYASAKKHEKK